MDEPFAALLADHESMLTRLGIGHPERSSLVRFLMELQAANREINLVSRKLTPRQLVEDHLLDSLIALPHLPPLPLIADLGSGGGFPAIPLAICRPYSTFELYEKSVLKGRFLARIQSWCPNLRVRGTLAADSLGGEVSLVIARAFKPLPAILEITGNYRQRGGRYLLYKGRRTKILEELAGVGLRQADVTLTRLPAIGQAEERHLLTIGDT
jgi:16S rRNA (guanine527-N7)-methyltransferase